jgi:arabinogalactan endo-1,4-beta-galactosidase
MNLLIRIISLLFAFSIITLANPTDRFNLANRGSTTLDSIGTVFIKGADISYLPQIEDNGGVYKMNGFAEDALQIFKDHGFNYIRLRLWHTPQENYNNLEKILYMATRIKNKGLKFLLDFHYSDTWADPGHQTKPAAWQALTFPELKDSVYTYTKNVLNALYNQGTLPDMVQLGNEINSGLLWNDGRVGGSYDSQWPNLADLLKEGVLGVRESCPDGDSVKIMIHIANAANNSNCRWFYDNLLAQGVNFDIIGLSFYPWWHGTLSQVRSNLNDLAGRYNKDIIIVEMAYPWTLQWFDSQNNMVGSSSQLHSGYPATVTGQAAYLRELIQIIRQTNGERGKGVFYWAPEDISVPSLLSSWENNTLFDFYGNTLESMNVFKEIPDSLKPITVKMILNTATNWDTLNTNNFVQVRGEVQGISYITLPDGRKITWDATSDLIMNNLGGDYWQTIFQMYPGDVLAYKFWTGFSKTKGTFLRLGWEGPVIPDSGALENTRIFTAGDSDTTLMVQYYNSSSETAIQYWQPFPQHPDTLAIYFRVNMDGAMNSGRFNPAVNGPVGVRGDSTASAGVLNWNKTDLILQREELSIFDGSFWSGVCYLPKNGLQEGQSLKYKFFIENDTQNGWENSIPDRELKFTAALLAVKNDTTLHWVYFDNSSIFTDLATMPEIIPNEFKLEQNYPNPFNNQTRIRYSLAYASPVTVRVYNLTGRLVAVLIDEFQERGMHSIIWDGTGRNRSALSSGVYILQLKTPQARASRKVVILK